MSSPSSCLGHFFMMSGMNLLRAFLGGDGVRNSCMNLRRWRAIDQETQEFWPAVVAARVHERLALVDEREVEVRDDHAFARAERLADQGAIGCHDRSKATARDWANAAAGILDDLRLLIGIQPGRRADDETGRFQCMLPDVDFRLLREQGAEDDPGYIAERICSPSAIIA